MLNSPEHLNKVLRIAFAATAGLLFSKIADLDDWGVFYTVMPILLLGLAPRLTPFVALQTLAAPFLGALVMLVYNLLSDHGLLFTLFFFIVTFCLFRFMAQGSYLLFGATGVLNTSIFLHFGSYPGAAFAPMLWANILAVVSAIFICGVVVVLMPQPAHGTPPHPIQKSPQQIRHQALMGSVIATLSFVVFQVGDLRDSLSAQATTILIMIPMTLSGVLTSGFKRAKGTLLGSSYAMLMQLILQTQATHLSLAALAFFIGILMFAKAHHLEGPGSGVAFGGMTTLAIIFGQYLTPQQDVIYSALYRISSVTVAVGATLALVYLLHHLLNRFDATRYVPQH